MRRVLFILALFTAGCGSPDGGQPDDTLTSTPAPPASTGGAPDAGSSPARGDAGADVEPPPRDAAPDKTPTGPACKKEITVVFSVGTGAGSLASHASSGCWTVVDADGAANPAFRKCSTSNYLVKNASAPDYAFDDTNPNDSLSAQQSFLAECASGASGEGFEYMAYRGSWRLLSAPHLKAYFAELYTTDDEVDDYWGVAGVYEGNAQLAKHPVYPMINIGPRTPPSNLDSVIQSDGLAMCKTVADKGYFGVYVGTWDQPMGDKDPRIVALANALDSCTVK
jgi:hypothetical protein